MKLNHVDHITGVRMATCGKNCVHNQITKLKVFGNDER